MRALTGVLTAAILLALTLPVFSQASVGGFFGGINIAKIAEDPQEEGFELSSRMGFLIGGIGLTKLSSSVSLIIAPAYIQRGTKIEATFEDPSFSELGTTEQSWRLGYADVPVLLRINFTRNAAGGPYLLAGPNIGILINAKARVESVKIGGVPQSIRDGDVDIKEAFKKVDLGLNIGGGIEFPVGNAAGSSLFLEATYNLGVFNIADTVEGDNTSVKNRGFHLKGGIMFPVNR